MPTSIAIHEVPFVAPIPAGHQVLIAKLRRSKEDPVTAQLALDTTASVLYCSDALAGPLSGGLSATTDPVGLLTTRWSWQLITAIRGVTVGAVVITSATPDRDVVLHTRLFVDATPSQPYR